MKIVWPEEDLTVLEIVLRDGAWLRCLGEPVDGSSCGCWHWCGPYIDVAERMAGEHAESIHGDRCPFVRMAFGDES